MVQDFVEMFEDETVYDDDTGEALELVDAGPDISTLGAPADTPVAEFQGVDTKSRRRFTFDEVEERIRFESKEPEFSELEMFTF